MSEPNEQPVANLATSENQPDVDEGTSESQPSVDEGTSEHRPDVDEDEDTSENQPDVDEGTSEHRPDVDEDTSENQPDVDEGTSESQPSVDEGTSENQPDVDEGTSEHRPEVDEGTSENQPDVDEDTSENQPDVNEDTSENQPDVDEGISEHRPDVDEDTSENQPDVDEGTSEDQAVANATSTRHPTGLLDLPLELRLMIFCHLLVFPDGSLDFAIMTPGPLPNLGILRTNRSIHSEAFGILYGENQFFNCSGPFVCSARAVRTYHSVTWFPRIVDTIQKIHELIVMSIRMWSIRKFLKLMRYFGSPSVIRGTLTLDIRLESSRTDPLDWFIQALGRFNNFRTVELHFYDDLKVHDRDRIFDVIEYVEHDLMPDFGYSEFSGGEGRGLRFHPMDHWSRLRARDQGDWADFLGGIRLGWNNT